MPSFRCKIKKLRFQGILTEKETERILDALDTAENTAEWIIKTDNEGTYGVCSNCRKEQCAGLLNYCPYCGRRMGVKE